MEWLNYHHLKYFWTVAREGTISAASRKLRVSVSTISEQIQALEDALGQPLFERQGRKLALNATGHVVMRYADVIFSTGQELLDYVHGRPTSGPIRLDVGIADVLPKMLVQRLLRPVFEQQDQRIHLVCRQGHPNELFTDLALHHLDVVFTDSPAGDTGAVKTFNHLLGQSRVTWVAEAQLAARYGQDFPHSLRDAPVLLPTTNTVLRRLIDHWLEEQGLHVKLVAEFEDSSVLKNFGASALGVFCVPEIILDDVSQQYGVQPLGVAQGVTEQFYAISTDRHIRHPAVRMICEHAKAAIFSQYES